MYIDIHLIRTYMYRCIYISTLTHMGHIGVESQMMNNVFFLTLAPVLLNAVDAAVGSWHSHNAPFRLPRPSSPVTHIVGSWLENNIGNMGLSKNWGSLFGAPIIRTI